VQFDFGWSLKHEYGHVKIRLKSAILQTAVFDWQNRRHLLKYEGQLDLRINIVKGNCAESLKEFSRISRCEHQWSMNEGVDICPSTSPASSP
jgi:hypothetical protein